MLLLQYLTHSLILAVYPILFVLASNWQEALLLKPGTLAAPLALSLSICVALFVLFRKLLGSASKSSLLCSLVCACFFSYGHLIRVLTNHFGEDRISLHVQNAVLIPYFLVFGWIGFRIVRAQGERQWLHTFLNVTTGFLLVSLSFTLGKQIHAGRQLQRKAAGLTQKAQPRAPASIPANRPDIYYIILDGYAGQSSLKRFYDFDNEKFLSFLSEKGFRIGTRSHSNYAFTALSLSSSLNMKHLDFLPRTFGETATDYKTPTSELIANNAVVRYIKSRGYKYIHFNSGIPLSNNNRNADVELAPQKSGWNELFYILKRTTLLRVLTNNQILNPVSLRSHLLGTISELPEVRAMHEGPLFVFAHIICPHPPFIFDEDGSTVDWAPSRLVSWENREGYLKQLKYLNQLMMQTVQEILERSPSPPIIVIQGDHGPASQGWANAGPDLYQELFPILNAYYLPGQGADRLFYDSISPVNSFRMIFNTYFGENFPMLPDQSFFSVYDHDPFRFRNVTDQLRAQENP